MKGDAASTPKHCQPEDVLHVQVDVEAVNEERRVAWLQPQGAFEELGTEEKKNIYIYIYHG